MRKAIKRIILRMFPELAGGYHLDRYARILKISDPPAAGSVCDRFRPYWAADIEILTPEGESAQGFPKYEAVPLPLPAAGQSAGFFLWPRPGTIVTVRWIEGRPDHPVIQHVYPMGLTLPDVPDNMGKWQQRTGVHQAVDPTGNWERITDKDIQDTAQNINQAADGNSTETVGTTKTVTAGQAYQVTAPTITIGNQTGTSLLPLITSALAAIEQALDILADHTHPGVGISDVSADVHGKADTVGDAHTGVTTLQN
ncbi:MAG: hypothetical protein K9L23_13035 [Desulfotignum sp.]|nr:hypothetical protein [Desulfotignum sp.]